MQQSLLLSLLVYDKDTGIFRWLKTRSTVRAGDVAGYIKDGYIVIGLCGKGYKAHRLAFLYMTGSFPVSEVDHIDQCRSNNSWSNLRLATRVTNARNCSKHVDGSSTYKGVSFCKSRNKWKAQIGVHYNNQTIGYFNSEMEAAEAYDLEALRLFGSFAHFNCPLE